MSVSVQHYVSFAVGLTASFSLMACDSPSRPLEATAQQLPSAEPASDGSAAARATPYRYSLNGPHASLYTSSDQGEVNRQVQLDLYTVTSNEAHLFYGIWECNLTTFDCVAVAQGDGPLYGDDVSTSRGRITVNINTAENPAFSLWDGSGGPINITWTELSGWSSESTIQTRYRQSDYSSHSHGTYTSTSALAEGTVLGIQLEPGSGFAQMGTVKDGGITIMREP
jgi:hypothetical protein